MREKSRERETNNRKRETEKRAQCKKTEDRNSNEQEDKVIAPCHALRDR